MHPILLAASEVDTNSLLAPFLQLGLPGALIVLLGWFGWKQVQREQKRSDDYQTQNSELITVHAKEVADLNASHRKDLQDLNAEAQRAVAAKAKELEDTLRQVIPPLNEMIQATKITTELNTKLQVQLEYERNSNGRRTV